MKTVKIGSATELEKFLRILAEESVTLARSGMSEPARQKAVAAAVKRDVALFNEEDEEPTPTPPPAKKPASPAPEPEPEAEPAAPVAKKEPAPTPAEAGSTELNPTLSSLIDAIKEMRGGRGASDSAVEAELTAYFDRLDEAERVALIVMMRSIAGIMQQNLMGADAPEPENYDILTTKKPESAEKPVAAAAPASQAAAAPDAAAGAEDTSPPIRVGEPVSEAYRARIRDLLSRTR